MSSTSWTDQRASRRRTSSSANWAFHSAQEGPRDLRGPFAFCQAWLREEPVAYVNCRSRFMASVFVGREKLALDTYGLTGDTCAPTEGGSGTGGGIGLSTPPARSTAHQSSRRPLERNTACQGVFPIRRWDLSHCVAGWRIGHYEERDPKSARPHSRWRAR